MDAPLLSPLRTRLRMQATPCFAPHTHEKHERALCNASLRATHNAMSPFLCGHSSDETWNGYFGAGTVFVANVETLQPFVPRLPGTALYARAPACDEVWTVGHGRPWCVVLSTLHVIRDVNQQRNFVSIATLYSALA